MNSPVYKAVFVAMPLTPSQMVYDMSNGAERSRTKAIVSVAGKTYTDEEMEYMAAMRVADSFHLPNKKLKALAAKYPPPPEWFGTEEEMPF
jgi:hypothetical protein